jgi:hypothetical protein
VNDTLTGTQINESTLGTVKNAGTVNGITVRRIYYAPTTATGGAGTTLVALGGLALGGLTLEAVCVPGGGGTGIVHIRATTAFTHAHLSSVVFNSGNSGQADGLHVRISAARPRTSPTATTGARRRSPTRGQAGSW